MGDQEIQDGQRQAEDAPVQSTFKTAATKIGRFLAKAFVAFIILGVLVIAGLIGFRFFTEDRTLAGEVSYQYLEEGFFLIVDNNDSTSWDDPTITVNGKYKFRSQDLNGKTRYNFDLTKFSTDSGERFLPNLTLPKTVRIESSWNSTEWSFSQPADSPTSPETGSLTGRWSLALFSGIEADTIDMVGEFQFTGRNFNLKLDMADERVRLAGTLSDQGNGTYQLGYEDGTTTSIQLAEDKSAFAFDLGGQEAVFVHKR